MLFLLLFLRFLNISLLHIFVQLLKVIVFSLVSRLVLVHHFVLVFLSVLMSTILTEVVMFLFASWTLARLLIRLIIGSFLINFLMITLMAILFVSLLIGFPSRMLVSDGIRLYHSRFLWVMLLVKVVFYPHTCLIDTFVICL